MIRSAHTAVLMVMGLLVSACGGDKATEPEIPPTPTPAALEATGTIPESAAAGTALSGPLRVQLLDEEGVPLSGISITWSVVAGGGSLSESASATGANGEASVSWTLGTVAGENEARATLEGLAPVVFKVLGVPGDPATVELLLGDGMAADSLAVGDIGESLQLGARVLDEHDNEITAPVVAWSTSDTAVAVVDTAGLITARGAGSVRITASAGSASREVVILASQKPAKVEIPRDTLQLYAIGDTLRLFAAVRDRNGVLMPSVRVTWRSLDPQVATINANGLVTAAAEGTTTIEARLDTLSARVPVVVTRAPGAIIVTPDSTNIAEGDTVRLAATVKDRNGAVMPDIFVTWRSLDPQVAAVDETGLVTGAAAGTTTIEAKLDTLSVRIPVVVTGAPASILVIPDSANLVEGDTVRLTATIKDRNGAIIQEIKVTWRSLDPQVATVDTTGLVTAAAGGTITIEAKLDSLIARTPVVVTPAPASIIVTPDSVNLAEGGTVRLDATAEDQNGAVLPGVPVTWTSADTTVATVAPDGLVTAKREGSVQITATSGKTSAPVTITVMGKIAFLQHGMLHVMNEDGSDGKYSGVLARSIAWSPDGATIAYHELALSYSHIFVRYADGSVKQLTTGSSRNESPSWSPDGSKIAFHSNRGDGQYRIHVMDADGGDITLVMDSTQSSDFSPVWSPDGSKLVFSRAQWLYTVNADGTDRKRLSTGNGSELEQAWSPDGSTIAFSGRLGTDTKRRIYLIPADGSAAPRPITDDSADARYPSWSPDGSRIVFQSQRAGAAVPQIYVMSADGTGITHITDGTRRSEIPAWRPRPKP